MRRLAALPFGLLLMLNGCGEPDPRLPFADSRIPPGLETRFYPPDGWAWGMVKVGKAPPARYGVSAPPGAPRGHVLILPDYGEPAEVWFETARDLNRRGLVVWVLEAAGQGGSGRYARTRDLGHAPAFAPDVAATQVMAARVIRGRPLAIVANGASAPVALAAFEGGTSAEALVLISPKLESQGDPHKARWMRRLGLGRLRAEGSGWRRQGPDDRGRGLTGHAVRGRVRLAWQTANPDLRMGSPSWAWRAAYDDAAVEAFAGLSRVRTPVLITVPAQASAKGAALCRAVPTCRVQSFTGGPALHLELDGVRGPWIEAVTSAAAPVRP